MNDLHEELMTYVITDWHCYTIIHAMIDSGQVTSLECQWPTCRMRSREFVKSGRRGEPLLMTLDHIEQRQAGGSHKIENLRLAHLGCNAGWRLGLVGSPMSGRQHTARSRESIGASIRSLRAFNPNFSPGSTGQRRSAKTREKQSVSAIAYRESRRVECHVCGGPHIYDRTC